MVVKKKPCKAPSGDGGKKNGKLLTSHRSTTYPCYLPVLGEFSRSWSYKTCRRKDKERRAKVKKEF